MKCRNCRIEVNSLSSNCPLCGSHLIDDSSDKEPAYPDPEKMAHNTGNKAVRILLFFTIVFSLSSYYANKLTPHRGWWSVIVIYSLWLSWLLIGLPIIKKKLTLFLIVLDYISVSGFLYMLDIISGHGGWAFGYVVPFLLCGSSLIISIVFIASQVNWRGFFLYEVFAAIMCFVPLLLNRTVRWPGTVSAVYGVLTIIGLVILGNRNFKNETKKRLHI
jgi:hypothetical protein